MGKVQKVRAVSAFFTKFPEPCSLSARGPWPPGPRPVCV